MIAPTVRSRAGGLGTNMGGGGNAEGIAPDGTLLTGKSMPERATWWRNAINPANGYAHLRDSLGRFSADFDPFKSGANAQYVEGNAWQLSYFVPQDVDGLIGLMGRKAFVDRLEWGFVTSEPVRYNAPGDAYWDYPVVQGNQQSMHFAFLFNWPVRSSPRLPSTWASATDVAKTSLSRLEMRRRTICTSGRQPSTASPLQHSLFPPKRCSRAVGWCWKWLLGRNERVTLSGKRRLSPYDRNHRTSRASAPHYPSCCAAAPIDVHFPNP